MCIVFIGVRAHPRYKLIVAANRDEFIDRPTHRATFWDDHPHILAGRDVERGGTWLGVSTRGKFAAITNFLEHHFDASAPARGALVIDFLNSPLGALAFARSIKHPHLYNGFNLVLARVQPRNPEPEAVVFGNRDPIRRPHRLDHGFHAVCNSHLSCSWHKVQRGKLRFAQAVLENEEEVQPARLFDVCADNKRFPEHMPRVFEPEWEASLSSTHLYSSLLACAAAVRHPIVGDQVYFAERTFQLNGDGHLSPELYDEREFRFQLEEA